MGRITWGATGPFEVQDWGGLKRVPRSDPRVANDPRWNNVEVPVSPGGDSLPDLPSGAEDDPTEGMDISGGSGSRAPPGDGDVDMTEARAAGPGGGGNNPKARRRRFYEGKAQVMDCKKRIRRFVHLMDGSVW